MPGLAMIGKVEATFECDRKNTIFRRFYVSSVAMSAETLAAMARAQWRIENCWTGCTMSVSTRTGRGTARITGPRTSRYSGNSRSRCRARLGPISPFEGNESAQHGPTSSPDPSSAKCDSPYRREPPIDILFGPGHMKRKNIEAR